MDSIAPIIQRAYDYYLKEDLRALLLKTINFTADRSLHMISKSIFKHRLVSATRLYKPSEHRIWYLDQEGPITISSPDLPVLEERFKGYPKKYHPPQDFVCELSNCYITGDLAVGLASPKEIISETTGHRTVDSFIGSRRYLIKNSLKSHLRSNRKPSDECIFPLMTPDPSYYHWMMEYLPKLRLLEYYINQTGNIPTILIEPDPAEFVTDTIKYLGYSPKQYTEWNGSGRVVRDLIVSTHRPHMFDYQCPKSSNYNPSRRDLNWLRKRMRATSNQNQNGSETTQRIYISRQNTTRGRKVINYEEMKDVFKRFGFESYNLEELSFSKQLEIFLEAEIIMGPHGAGLLNMIFSEDPYIIELFPKSIIKPHFFFLSDIMGFNYNAIIFEDIGGDLIVDVESVKRKLNHHLDIR